MSMNNILDRVQEGKKALGLTMSDPLEELVEMAGRMGLDYVGFDAQHSPITAERVGQLCRVADGFGITPTMRIPDQSEKSILSYLDKGIRMITVPNLQTKEEAEAIVKYSYFAPIGLRSATSLRTVFNQTGTRKELFEEVNAATIVVPQLESITAFNNLDSILEVDGLTYFAGGPEDIAQSMGLPGGHADPRAVEAYSKATDKVRAAGKFMIDDITDNIPVFQSVQLAAEALLEKHGRKTKLSFN